MTEEEAKTKWCPHAIASHTNPRQKMGDGWLHNCIGSACMAWRWDNNALTIRMRAEVLGKAQDEIMTPEYYARNHMGDEHEALPREGFCGLAGRP